MNDWYNLENDECNCQSIELTFVRQINRLYGAKKWIYSVKFQWCRMLRLCGWSFLGCLGERPVIVKHVVSIIFNDVD